MFFMGGIHDQLESHVFELASHTYGGAQMRGNLWLLFVTLLVDLVWACSVEMRKVKVPEIHFGCLVSWFENYIYITRIPVIGNLCILCPQRWRVLIMWGLLKVEGDANSRGHWVASTFLPHRRYSSSGFSLQPPCGKWTGRPGWFHGFVWWIVHHLYVKCYIDY